MPKARIDRNVVLVAVLAAGIKLGAASAPLSLFDCEKRVAKAMGVAPTGVHKWVNAGTMARAQARYTIKLGELSGLPWTALMGDAVPQNGDKA